MRPSIRAAHNHSMGAIQEGGIKPPLLGPTAAVPILKVLLEGLLCGARAFLSLRIVGAPTFKVLSEGLQSGVHGRCADVVAPWQRRHLAGQ